MKILQVRFKNINSLKGEHEIDFTAEAFQQNPIFAITGQTGSGKTTILDVISLALYGEVPRLGKITKSTIEKQGAILTRNQKEAYAEVVYDCQYGKYRSIWSIDTNRNDNLRDHEMEISQIDPDLVLDLKKLEVPPKNTELIGLSYKQFNKSAMLAQGEFAKFLKSDRNKRSALLEQITGTGIYRKLGIKAFYKHKEAAKEIEQELNTLEKLKEDLLPKEEIKSHIKSLDEINREIETYGKQLDTYKSELALKKDLKELQEKIKSKKEELTDADKARKNFIETYGSKLENHEKVQGFSGDIQTWSHQKNQLENLKKELGEEQKKNGEYQKNFKATLSSIQTFVGKTLTPENASTELQRFYKEVKELIEKKSLLLQNYQSEIKLFRREISELDTDYKAEKLVKDKALWQSFRQQFATKKQEVFKEYKEEVPTDIERAIRQAEEKSAQIQNAKIEAKEIENLQKEIDRFEKDLNELSEKLKPIPAQLEKLESKKETEGVKLKNLRLEQETQMLRTSLKDLRKQLQKDEPCPLCGAQHHPYATHLPPEKSALDQKILEQESILNTYQNKLSELIAHKESYTTQKEKIGKIKTEKQSGLYKRKSAFNTKFSKELTGKKTNWEALIDAQKDRIKTLRTIKEYQHQERSLQTAIPIFEHLQEILSEGKEIRQKIDNLYKGEEGDLQKNVKELESKWQDINSKLVFSKGQIKKINGKIEKEEGVFEKHENNLLAGLEKIGFSQIFEAKSFLLSGEDYKNLKIKNETLRDKIKSLNTEIKTLQETEKGQSKKIKTTHDIDALTSKKEELEDQLRTKNQIKNDLDHKLKKNKELLKKIAKLDAEIKVRNENIRRWKVLDGLIGSAGGDVFSRFAQDLTLRQLIKLANRRLKGLTNRYLLVPPDPDKDDMKISDLDMGGEMRSVKTLSGGESFLISLSLALALSDLASKTVTINSLFIDEGFGTLDQETLDQTLDTLERLQAQTSKTIGIISHVESLKERIGTQIQLHRDGRGYSTMKITSGGF